MNRTMQKKKESLAQVAKQAMGRHGGPIVFTNSNGLVAVGLPGKGSRITPKTCITTPDGKTKDGNHGWGDHYKDGEFNVEDGTTTATTVTDVTDDTDDTDPGGPRQVNRTHTAAFARANREEDRTAWAFFKKDKITDWAITACEVDATYQSIFIKFFRLESSAWK